MNPDIAELHFPALVIDGSGRSIFIGVLGVDLKWIGVSEQDGTPSEDLFRGVQRVLKAARIRLSAIRSYLYCEGPGSVLGLRLCAMAVGTWSQIYPESANLYSYNSLRLSALILQSKDPDLEEALIVSDWKKGVWNAIRLESGSPGPVEVIEDTRIRAWTGRLYHLPQRKGWQPPPQRAKTLVYDPALINQVYRSHQLLTPTQGIQLYRSGLNTFKKWTPDRYRLAR